MAASTSIIVSILGEAKQFEASLTKTQKAVSVFGAAATAAFVAYGVQAVKAFSAAEQQQTKLSFALSKSPKLFDANTEALASFNKELGNKTALDDDAIAGAQATLVKYAETSLELEKLTQLTVDYARFTGKELPAAALVIGKATDGQTSALKALGITYTKTGNVAKDAANIQQLLNDTVAGYGEIYADTAAGKTEALAVAYQDLQQAIGEGVEPIQSFFNDALAAGINLINRMPNGLKQGAFGIGFLGSAALAIIPQIIAMRANMLQANITMASMKANAIKAGTALKSNFSTIAKIGTPAMIALTTAITSFVQERQSFDDMVAGWGDAAGKAKQLEMVTAGLNAELSYINDLSTASNPIDFIQNAVGNDDLTPVITQLNNLGVAQTDLLEALKRGPEEYQGFVGAIVDAAKASGTSSGDIQLLKTNLDNVGKSYEEAGAKGSEMAEFTGEVGNEAKTAAQKTQELVDKVQALIDKFTILRQGFLDQRQATRAYEAALDDADKALKENGRTLNRNTAAGRANQEALDGIAIAGNDAVLSMIKQKKPLDEVMARYRQSRQDLIAQARQFGMSEQAAERYADRLLRTPKQVRTDAKLITDDQGIIEWNNKLRGIIDTITTNLNVDWGFGSTGGSPPHAAEGGYVSRSGLAVIHKGETYSGVGSHRKSLGGDGVGKVSVSIDRRHWVDQNDFEVAYRGF